MKRTQYIQWLLLCLPFSLMAQKDVAKGWEKVSATYSFASFYQGDRCVVESTDRQAFFLNSKGKVKGTIEDGYSPIHYLKGYVPSGVEDELIRVYDEGFVGFCNPKGKIVVPVQYHDASRFEFGMAVVNDRFYDDFGDEEFVEEDDWDENESEVINYVVEEKLEVKGFWVINKKGETVYPADSLCTGMKILSEHRIAIAYGNNVKIVDLEGTEIASLNNVKLNIKRLGKHTFIVESEEVVYDAVKGTSEEDAEDDEEWDDWGDDDWSDWDEEITIPFSKIRLLDDNGNWIIEKELEVVSYGVFENEMYLCGVDGIGWMNADGSWIKKFKLELQPQLYYDIIYKDVVCVGNGTSVSFFTAEGDICADLESGESLVQPYPHFGLELSTIVQVEKDKKVGLKNIQTNEWVVESTYTSIEQNDGGGFLARHSEGYYSIFNAKGEILLNRIVADNVSFTNDEMKYFVVHKKGEYFIIKLK